MHELLTEVARMRLKCFFFGQGVCIEVCKKRTYDSLDQLDNLYCLPDTLAHYSG